jgi:hypothetical protein
MLLVSVVNSVASASGLRIDGPSSQPQRGRGRPHRSNSERSLMANYLTQNDVDAYGHDLVDFSQRAAMQAVAPYIQNLKQQTADLRARQAQQQRRRLDQAVDAAVSDFREVDRNPRWHQWLLGVDQMSGRIRQVLLNDAIDRGNTARVVAFFRQFQQTGQTAPGLGAVLQRRPSPRGRIYTRPEITRLYEQHRRGAYAGREAEWARQEADIIAAGREGRVASAELPSMTK